MFVVTKTKPGEPKMWLAADCTQEFPWFTSLPQYRMEFTNMIDAVKFSKGIGKNIGLQDGESVQIEEETVRKLAKIECGEEEQMGRHRSGN